MPTEPLLGWADGLAGWKGHRPSADRVSVRERKAESPECWGWAHKSCRSNWTATGKAGHGEKGGCSSALKPGSFLLLPPPKEHQGQNWRVSEPPDRPQRQPSPARPSSEQTVHMTVVEVWKCPVPGLPGWPADAPREAGSADQLGGRARP